MFSCLSVCANNVIKSDQSDSLRKENDLIDILGFSNSDAKRLWHHFNILDVDNSGEISLSELFTGLNISETDFNNRVFSMFDKDKSGEIDFGEFITSLWNYCTLTKLTLVVFAFDLYDRDDSGFLEAGEIAQICMDSYGPKYKHNKLAKNIITKTLYLSSTLGDQSGQISLKGFIKFCDSHPALLFPAFSFQRELQRKIMGVNFWRSFNKRRLRLGNRNVIPIRKFLQQRQNQSMMKADVTGTTLHDSTDQANRATKRNSVLDLKQSRQTESSFRPRAISEQSSISKSMQNRKLNKIEATPTRFVAIS